MSLGVDLEKTHALIDCYNEVEEYGDDVKLYLRDEDDVTRDAYNSITKSDIITPYEYKSYPITFQPTDEQMREAGIFERVDIMFYIPCQYFINSGLFTIETINDFDIDVIRGDVVYKGNTYTIKDKALSSQFANCFLYIVIGASRK